MFDYRFRVYRQVAILFDTLYIAPVSVSGTVRGVLG